MDDVVLLVGLVDGDVHHEPGRCGAVPVLFVSFEEHTVPWPDDLDGTAAPLAQTDAFSDKHGLAERVAETGGFGRPA